MKTYHSNLAFAVETEDYYICAWTYTYGSGLGYRYYYIEIVDRDDLSLRSYPTAIITGSSSRGDYHARPENPAISEDGTKLTYTATVEEDAYRYLSDCEGNVEHTLIFQKGIYTVTMDLKTGEQTYTRADLP
jgi:hypothetical protein